MDRSNLSHPHAAPPPPCPPDRTGRLRLPARLAADLGYDAVGLPREHGERMLHSLPRVGCVFADDRRWWWIVPSGSQIGVEWPPTARYAVGARLTDPSWTRTQGARPEAQRPGLLHAPRAGSPYTPPLPLYFLTCRLAGSAPRWTLTAG
ncbi:hypothetical protein [Streptomyces ziwulingensis]|uniref:SpoVT-AbrB domain-containing protein n=1 Tax=Streptomyces ziwulingensis TaxID=1045501 RepID=A0ABP9BSX9_9ACTN